MAKMILGAALMTGLVGTAGMASAADLAIKAPAPILRAAPVSSWTGFYIGGQIGANNLSTEASGYDTAGWDNHPSGGLPWGPLSFPITQPSAGVFVGYDYQIGRFVVGIEGDYNRVWGSNHSTIPENEYPGEGGIWRIKNSWNASIRGRLGYLVTDRALLYGTGGVAFTKVNVVAGVENDFFCASPCNDPHWGNIDIGGNNRVGWTAGVGGQYALDPNWSMRVEYRYSDYGTKRLHYTTDQDAGGIGHVDTKVTANAVSVGLSYKFGSAGYSNY